MGGIFVSYRRSDSQGEAGRLFDDLVKHFDEHTVFIDVSAIEAGRDFRKAIEEGVTKCGVLLVVMGPEWLNAKDERGARRLDDPADFVRIETAAALKRDIPVIPVLVRSARMPSAEHLPEELKELAYRNCIELTHARWRSDIQLLIEALRRLLGDPSQAGTKVGPNPTAASARRTQEEVAGSAKVEGGSARIDPAALQQVSRELALHIGPIAGIVVKRAAPQCNSIEDLYLKVAGEIDSPDERQKFLVERVPISSTPLPDIARATTLAKNAAEPSEVPPLSEKKKVGVKPPPPTTGARLSRRWRYLLLASGGGVVLVAVLIFSTRFGSSKGADSSQTLRPSPQEATVEKSATDKAGIPPPPAETSAPVTRPPNDSGPKSPLRVRVSQEESRGLLVTTVLPVYPPLARQAHVQGAVVLDADISKDGTVETLKAISGHPMLIPAAVDAVKQWRYKPYVVKGEPVAVNTQIVVNFTLSGG